MRYFLFSALLILGGFVTAQTKAAFSFKTTSHFSVLPLPFAAKVPSLITLPVVKPYHFGAICRWENYAQAGSKMPLAFRLGSADYVRGLENHYVVNYGQYSYHYRPRRPSTPRR